MRDTSGLTTDELADAVCEQAAHLHAATCRFLALVAEFDRREGWAEWGCCSCAQWLSWRCGVGPRAGREQVRVARALAELPMVQAAFGRGELSYSKVRALCRMATPATEAGLVATALHATASQLEAVAGHYRRAQALQDEKEVFERRYLHWGWADDGSLELRCRLPAADGAIVLAAIEALTAPAAKPAPGEAGVAASIDPIDHRRADALVALAQGAGVTAELVVHVEDDVLAGTQADGRCHTEAGQPVGTEAARRMACDGSVRHLVDDGFGKTLDVGRRTRAVSAALRRALRARDGGCVFPGCGETRWVDAHHVRHWAEGGATALENLVELCGRHHRLLHEGGYRLQRLDGQVKVWGPPWARADRGQPLPAGAWRPHRRSASAGRAHDHAHHAGRPLGW